MLQHCSWISRQKVLTPHSVPKTQSVADIVADSIKNVSSLVARELVTQYAVLDDKGAAINIRGGYPGVLYPPYYWWQAGAMFGTLLDYWHYTGDDQYNNIVRDGLIHQFGDNNDLVRFTSRTESRKRFMLGCWAGLLLTPTRCPRISPRTKATMTKSSGPSP